MTLYIARQVGWRRMCSIEAATLAGLFKVGWRRICSIEAATLEDLFKSTMQRFDGILGGPLQFTGDRCEVLRQHHWQSSSCKPTNVKTTCSSLTAKLFIGELGVGGMSFIALSLVLHRSVPGGGTTYCVAQLLAPLPHTLLLGSWRQYFVALSLDSRRYLVLRRSAHRNGTSSLRSSTHSGSASFVAQLTAAVPHPLSLGLRWRQHVLRHPMTDCDNSLLLGRSGTAS